MKNINLTEEQINLILDALSQVHSEKIKLVQSQSCVIMPKEAKDTILKSAESVNKIMTAIENQL
jgi:hypothetical protein